jgi:D-aminoacyl-tRNA deacylase
LAEAGRTLGLPATYEATHHGPAADHPSFFVEIGFGRGDTPPADAVAALARLLPMLAEDPSDRIALGIGGGHYVPHLTELALDRRWAFGHLVSRHGFAAATRTILAEALEKTPGAEGIVFARTADAEDPKVDGLGRRLRESEAPQRDLGPA